jgi:hypothetical protein
MNGLRMVCVAQPGAGDHTAGVAAHTESDECEEICLLHRKSDAVPLAAAWSADHAQPSAICLFAPDDHHTCTAAFAFAVATPAMVVDVDAGAAIGEVVPDLPALYRSPSLASLSPPPKA